MSCFSSALSSISGSTKNDICSIKLAGMRRFAAFSKVLKHFFKTYQKCAKIAFKVVLIFTQNIIWQLRFFLAVFLYSYILFIVICVHLSVKTNTHKNTPLPPILIFSGEKQDIYFYQPYQ